MDVAFSPDAPAWVCFTVVLFFGALTGWREVVDKLGDPIGVWRHGTTWRLLTLLAVTPALVFWLLDRAGALNDTSLVGAAIVGLAYTQILKGDTAYKAPGSTNAIWEFLDWWRIRVGKSLADKTAANALAFDNAACEEMAGAGKLQGATDLALKLCEDPAAFSADVAGVHTQLSGITPTLNQSVIDFRIAELLYREIQCDINGRDLMVEDSLIPQSLVDKHFGSDWTGRIIAAVLLVLAGVGVWGLNTKGDGVTVGNRVERAYLSWRLEKPTTTLIDLNRTTGAFMSRLRNAEDTPEAVFWTYPLREILRNPTVPMPRIEATIQLLLAARDSGKLSERAIAENLTLALRNTNIDSRRRVQAALVYLSQGLQPEAPADLTEWNPTEGDSVPQIEQRIDQWRRAWAKRPVTLTPREDESAPARR